MKNVGKLSPGSPGGNELTYMMVCVVPSPQVSLTDKLSHNTGRWTTFWNGSVTMWRATSLMHTAWVWRSAPWMVTLSARCPRTRWSRPLAHNLGPTSTRACRNTRPVMVNHHQIFLFILVKKMNQDFYCHYIKAQQYRSQYNSMKKSNLTMLLA